jgi:hypothetical protein
VKHISRQSAYAKNIHEVELTAEESTWSDYRLITMVDRGGCLSASQWDEIRLSQSHPGHFGGEVRKYLQDDGSVRATITVYTD